MARGLGLLPDLVIDQHFAQRARIERLVGAVAEDPGVLGIGIDEDTAVIVEDRMLRIIGSGAVYVADGQGITYTNVSERTPDRTLSLFDLVCTFYRTARFSISKVDGRTVWRGQSEALDYFSSRLTRIAKPTAERQACKPALVRAQVRYRRTIGRRTGKLS